MDDWYFAQSRPGLATVIVIAFNQDWVLAQTLGSVAAQTYRPLECVIVDDGSTDNTAAVVNEFVRRHSGDLIVKSIYQRNRGSQTARNAGIQASTGEFIQFLDGDDLIEPNKIESQITFLNSSIGAGADVVYGDAKWLLQVGQRFEVGKTFGLGPADDFVAAALGDNTWALPGGPPPFAYLCRRRAVALCGPWNLNTRTNQDEEYFLRMASRGARFAYFPLMTGFYRVHDRPRISRGNYKIFIEDTLSFLLAIEAELEGSHLLTSRRRAAFAAAYRR